MATANFALELPRIYKRHKATTDLHESDDRETTVPVLVERQQTAGPAVLFVRLARLAALVDNILRMICYMLLTVQTAVAYQYGLLLLLSNELKLANAQHTRTGAMCHSDIDNPQFLDNAAAHHTTNT